MEGNLSQKSTNLLGGWKTVRWFELERRELVPKYEPLHILATEADAIAKAADEKTKKELEQKANQRKEMQRRASSKPGLAPQLEMDGATVIADGKDTFILKKKAWAHPEMMYKVDDSVKDPILRERERDAWVAALAVFKAAPLPPGHLAQYQVLGTPSANGAPASPDGTRSSSPSMGGSPNSMSRGSIEARSAPFYVLPEATVRALEVCFKFLQEKKQVQLTAPDPAAVTQVVTITRSLLLEPNFKLPADTAVMTVASVTRALLKRLPESIFSGSLIDLFYNAAGDAKLDEVHKLVHQLPPVHKSLLQSLLLTARVFTKDSNYSRVANALGPSLTTSIEDDKEYEAKSKDKMIALFTVLMTSYDSIFGATAAGADDTGSSVMRDGTLSADAVAAALDAAGTGRGSDAKPADSNTTATSDAAAKGLVFVPTTPAGKEAAAAAGGAEGNTTIAAANGDKSKSPSRASTTTSKDDKSKPDRKATTTTTEGKAADKPTGAAAAAAGTTTGDATGSVVTTAGDQSAEDKEKTCRMCGTSSCVVM